MLDLAQLMPFYGEGEDELNLAFNFLFVHAPLEAEALRAIVEGIEQRLPPASWPVWTGSNHDAGRLATRWAEGDPARARLAVMMLLTLRGTPFLYYGDEIGLPDVPLDPADALDPVPRRTGKPERNRDPCRTPMQWTAEAGAGFTEAGVETWLPIGDAAAFNVADQRADGGSQLHLTRDLIALRRAQPDLRERRLRDAARAGGRVGVAARRGPRGRAQPLRRRGRRSRAWPGRVAIATDRARDGEAVDGALTLGAWQGAVIETSMSVEGLDPLLSPEGWVYASTPPLAEGDPGRYHALFGRDSLITALQVLPARPDVARATLRALAALQGQRDDPETDEEPGKILHEYRPDAPAWHTEHGWPVRDGVLRYYGSSDSTLVVPRAARGARRRCADGGARAGVARGRRLARARAGGRRRARPLRPARALRRPHAAGLARRHGPGGRGRRRRRHRPPRRLDAARPARRHRRPGRRLRGAARARRCCPATRPGAAAPRRCRAGSRATSAPA